MNNKAIILIIGLMGAALIGVCYLQVQWIRFSISLNEEQFDRNVFAALSKVAERMEYEEQLEFYNFMNNGYAQSFMENEIMNRILEGDVTISVSYENLFLESPNLSKEDLLTILVMNQEECDSMSLTSASDRMQNFSRAMQYYHGLDYASLTERIRLDQLDALIQKELNDRGISTHYNYGVYSKRKKSFVIANNHYVVTDNQPQVTKEGYENLYVSRYRVNLFQGADGISPGLLMVFFPARASFVWGSVWKTLVAAIVFTGIIMFCFAYTIQVIFRQKKVSEMKNDFINNMTHEFKTPIATISLAADSIGSPMISSQPEKVTRFANIIKAENKRMNSQVEKVLQMALLDKKDFNLKLTQVNLHDVIHRAIENISLQVEKRGGNAEVQLEAMNPMVEGDLTHISNIINNLLDNANKYSPETPEITIFSRDKANGVEVVVQDKGVGMSKEARKHIFDKFYRVHTGNLHDVKGFGLGLSYVKAMMLAHKGAIDVKSELGKGSNFILFFPYQVENRPVMS